MRLRLILPLLVLPFAPLAAAAQDNTQTLADIRVELGTLAAEFNALKAELATTGNTASIGGGDALQRMDSIEAELARLTSRAEEIELKLNRVVADGTNRIGDIEFRLCEVTPGCDPMNMGATAPLGGDTTATATPAPTETTASSGGPELAVGEQADFDRAKEVLGQGDFPRAAELFALLKLGQALGDLGQTPEACVTLAEVGTQYPGSMAATQAPIAMQGLGCP